MLHASDSSAAESPISARPGGKIFISADLRIGGQVLLFAIYPAYQALHGTAFCAVSLLEERK